MKEINCLNFCEITHDLKQDNDAFLCQLKEAKKMAGYISYERLYFGSYFCSQYFLSLSNKQIESLIQKSEEFDFKLTLVLPVFTQCHLKKAKEKLESLKPYFGKYIDEITVNDYGMLEYVKKTYQIKLNMGRLFMKDYRELRYPEYFNMVLKPRTFTSYFNEVIKKYEVNVLEFDPTHRKIDFSEKPQDVEIGIHEPYCYMTTGQICEVGSAHKEIHEKFRPNEACQIECQDNRIKYLFNDGHNWIKVGRTVYFDNKDLEVCGLEQRRRIYSPMESDEMMQIESGIEGGDN